MYFSLYENKYKLPGKNQNEVNEVYSFVRSYHEGTREKAVEKELRLEQVIM